MLRKVTYLLMAMALAASTLVGCGSARESASTLEVNADMRESAANSSNGNLKYGESKAKENVAKSADGSTSIGSAGAASQSISNAILSQRKIILNANMTVEVEDFDVAYGKIKSMISAFGYVQESNVRKEKVYIGSGEKLITKGTIVIRVDKDKFDSVLSGIHGVGMVIEETSKGDEVTDKFFDTESRLRLLKYEQNRLEQYLNRISDPDVIFKTESRLTEIRYEIEGLTGTLNKLNDLVQLSTITINLNEKNAASAQNSSYWERLISGFAGSINGMAVFLGELVIVLAQALPVLIFIGILAFIGYRRYNHISKNCKIPKKDNKDSDIDIEM